MIFTVPSLSRPAPCKALCFFVVIFSVAAVSHAADLRLNGLFADHMVLQRDKPVPVWGWAEPGEKISVSFAGQTKSTETDANGRWRVTLDPLAVSASPVDLKITGKSTSLEVHDVLVGDVWLCAGDFGVFYEMFKVVAAEEEIAAAAHPTLRLFKIPKKSSNAPLEKTDGEWRVCAPETVTDFSALAYFFGRALQRDLGVPIGLIDASYPYSYVRGWTPAEGFLISPELATPREKMESWDPTTAAGKAAFAATLKLVEDWLPLAEAAFRENKPIPPQPRLPAAIPADDSNYRSNGELSLNYNAMIHPLLGFSLRGMIWSQGENGCQEVEKHRFYLQGLWQSWRQAWGQGDFPIYTELLPRVGKPDEAPGVVGHFGQLREQQILAVDLVSNTAAIATYDVSDYVADERNRQDAGERLARLALAGEYQKTLESNGPRYQKHEIKGDTIAVTFDHAAAGLMAGNKEGLAPVQERKDGKIVGFIVAGEDQKWHPAEARAEGNTVIVRSDKVPSPVAVRYAFADDPGKANLYNHEGLPALPFRTDGSSPPQALLRPLNLPVLASLSINTL